MRISSGEDAGSALTSRAWAASQGTTAPAPAPRPYLSTALRQIPRSPLPSHSPRPLTLPPFLGPQVYSYFPSVTLAQDKAAEAASSPPGQPPAADARPHFCLHEADASLLEGAGASVPQRPATTTATAATITGTTTYSYRGVSCHALTLRYAAACRAQQDSYTPFCRKRTRAPRTPHPRPPPICLRRPTDGAQLCAAVCMEFCDCGSVATAMAAGAFHRRPSSSKGMAPGAADAAAPAVAAAGAGGDAAAGSSSGRGEAVPDMRVRGGAGYVVSGWAWAGWWLS